MKWKRGQKASQINLKNRLRTLKVNKKKKYKTSLKKLKTLKIRLRKKRKNINKYKMRTIKWKNRLRL